MTATAEPRQLQLLKNAIGTFPALWEFVDRRSGYVEAETVNPGGTMILRIVAGADSGSILVTLLRAPDRRFMAEAQFPLSAWQAAKEFLESIVLEAFVAGVDEREGSWTGSMILRSADLERRRDFTYIRSWLGTYDRN